MIYVRQNIYGLNTDVDPIEINQGDIKSWTSTVNMTPRNGRMERALGYQWQWSIDTTPGAEVGALTAPYYLDYSPQLSTSYWVYAGSDAVVVVDDAWGHTDITPIGGLVEVEPGEWSGGNLNGIAILSSPNNNPIYWSSGEVQAQVLPGLRAGTRYNILRPFKYHLIGMGVLSGDGTFEDALHWSDAADPGAVPDTWVPADDNEAGDNVLADETGKIIDGLSLRDSFFIYKQDAVYEMSYTGGLEVFRFTKVFRNAGALGKNCVVRVKGTHVVLGAGDIYQHDGQNYRSLGEGRVKKAVFGAIDTLNFERSFVCYLESENKVWICFPREGSDWPDTAVIWDPDTDAFGVRDIKPCSLIAPGVAGPPSVGAEEAWDDDGKTWNTDSSSWLQATIVQSQDSLVMADPVNSRFYVANTGTTADGDDYDSSLSVYGLDLGDPSVLKAVRRMRLRMQAPDSQSFALTVFGQDSPDDPPRQGPVVLFKGPQKEGIPVNINTRYLGFELRTQDALQWQCSGVDVSHFPRGPF